MIFRTIPWRRVTLFAISTLLVLLFLFFVWPTRYVYYLDSHRLIRLDRISGEVDVVRPHLPPRLPEEVPTPQQTGIAGLENFLAKTPALSASDFVPVEQPGFLQRLRQAVTPTPFTPSPNPGLLARFLPNWQLSDQIFVTLVLTGFLGWVPLVYFSFKGVKRWFRSRRERHA